MSKINWQDVVVSPETSLREAIAYLKFFFSGNLKPVNHTNTI
ncbi:hypothetical protein [Sphaerospermopsis torques-reginae]|nr:hypothetical protein [Sphaerospermopsis torques-reginae]